MLNERKLEYVRETSKIAMALLHGCNRRHFRYGSVQEFGRCMENKGYEFDGPRKTTL
jgi:hypothetical protein